MFISLTECSGSPESAHLELTTTIELKNITTSSDNNGILRGMFQLTSVPVLSDVVTFFRLNRIVISKWDFLDCAIYAFSERYYSTTFLYVFAFPDFALSRRLLSEICVR